MQLAVENLAATAAHVDALPRVAYQAQVTTISALGARYLATLQAETPGGRGANPGGLRAAYKIEEGYSPLELVYRIRNDAPHLKWVVGGRGSVEAKNARALRFVIGGQVIFRRRVGPAAPNNFPARAAQSMAPVIAQARASLPGLIVRSYGQ